MTSASPDGFYIGSEDVTVPTCADDTIVMSCSPIGSEDVTMPTCTDDMIVMSCSLIGLRIFYYILYMIIYTYLIVARNDGFGQQTC